MINGFKYFKVRKSKNDKCEYRFKKLLNNLNCLIIYDKDADKSAGALNVGVGSLLDPEEYQGIAHFCEHMLFMGTEKYPEENDFSEFLSKNSGDSNAWTDLDSTNYYFDISNDKFPEALDRFAQFFSKPLFNKSAVEREMKAVESENKKYSRSDNNRFHEIIRHESNEGSPFKKFMNGNLQTLKKPKIRKALLKFHDYFYSSHIMNLVILTNKELDKMEEMVDHMFENVNLVNSDTLHRLEDLNFAQNNLYPYDTTNTGYFYKILPVKDKLNLSFQWFINENINHLYKYEPLYYINCLLGHEGPNSLASSLFKDELITDLESSYDIVAHTYTNVYIDVALTEKGYKNYLEIIRRVFYFIKKIQGMPIDKEFFEELQDITKIEFDFFEKDDPMNICSDTAHNMALYEPEDIISGPYLIEYYDEAMIKKYMDAITTDNMNIYLTSKKFEEEFHNDKEVIVEKWYGTKYKKEKFDFEQIDKMMNLDVYDYSVLGYPPKNVFLPKNLELINLDQVYDTELANAKVPQKIYKDENTTIWYKPDNKFKIPKAFIYANIYLADQIDDLDSATYATFSRLWSDMFNYELKETLYMGSLAKLQFDLYFSQMGMGLEISGFNDTLKLFTFEITNQFVNFTNDILNNADKYKNKLLIRIEDYLKDLKNLFLGSSSTQVNHKLDHFLKHPIVDHDIKIKILEELRDCIINKNNCEKFKHFIQNYLNKSYFEWLIEGNITIEESQEITKYVQNKLQKNTLRLDETSCIRVTCIPENNNYYHLFESQDLENENSAIASYFQCGYLSERDSCILHLIVSILQEKFFDELRTKQALGYTVSLAHRYYRKIEGVVCLVQSNVQSPEYIYQKINKFFDDNSVDLLDEKEFKNYVKSMIVDLKQKDLNIGEEVERLYNEIHIREYFFNRDEERIKIYENLKLEEVIEFYDEHFVFNAKRISVELVAKAHKEDNEKHLNQNEKDHPERIRIHTNEGLKRRCELFPDYYYHIAKI